MINITTSLFPYRLDSSQKNPIELSLKIKNMSSEAKLLSLDIILQKTLSLDKSGLKKSEAIRLGEIKPDEIIFKKFYVYPFQGIKPGDNKVLIRVCEHYLDYNSLKEKTEKIIYVRSI